VDGAPTVIVDVEDGDDVDGVRDDGIGIGDVAEGSGVLNDPVMSVRLLEVYECSSPE